MKFSCSLLIPVLNEAKNLPALFAALDKNIPATVEILFIDNGSSDHSLNLLEGFRKKTKLSARILKEQKKGFPEPLLLGAREAQSEAILLLDADCLPTKTWIKEMLIGLKSSSIVVGNTESKISAKPTDVEKLAALIFEDYSEFCVFAKGHALPWGPACNIGFHKKVYEKVGSFSSAAGSAFDIDWCWRAVLLGETIGYSVKAKVFHRRRKEKEAFLEQMERYGRGEAWLRHAFSFLEDEAPKSSYALALDAFRRLSGRKNIPKALQALLQETAAAHAFGVLAGELNSPKSCEKKRELPKKPIHWISGKKEITAFVPGKGVTTLSGKSLKVWAAMQSGASESELAHLLEDLFKLTHEEAHHEAEHFFSAFMVEA